MEKKSNWKVVLMVILCLVVVFVACTLIFGVEKFTKFLDESILAPVIALSIGGVIGFSMKSNKQEQKKKK